MQIPGKALVLAAALGGLLAPVLMPTPAQAGTLDDVRSRGRLECGVSQGIAGFAAVDANGVWSGFEVEFCRALAAAVLGDASLAEMVPLPIGDRFGPLVSGGADLVARGAAWSITPDAGLSIDLVAVSYFDQLGFLIPVEMGISSARELDGSTVCLLPDMVSGQALDDFFRGNAITWTPVPTEDDSAARRQYLDRTCETYARSAAELYAIRATFEMPASHVVITDPASRQPSGPVVRQGDDQWADIVRWTFNALIAAEGLGVTSANVREMAAAPTANPEINRLLGTEGEFGALMGLSRDWAVNAIAAGGNYGEIFERHIGENTPIGLARGLNALWTKGGLQYAAPFR